MANEFIIREGFRSKSNVIVTGSLTVTSITGSLVTASYGITASYSLNSNTASLVQTIISASYSATALSASIASASYDTLNNPAALYAPIGISSSGWTTNAGNNGYISSNLFYTNGNIGGGNTAAFRTGSYTNTIYLTPIYISKTGTLARFAIVGTVLGAPTGSWRVGVYSNSSNMLPETKVFEFSSNILPGATRTFYEVTSSSGPILQQGQIYWLAASAEGLVSNISYTYLQHTAAVRSMNKLISPLLGSTTPILENAIRNVAHYRYNIPTTGSALPALLSQSISFYTASVYGGDMGGGSNLGTVHIGPFIKLNY